MLQTFKLRQTLCLQQSGLETSRQLVPALSRLHGWLPCRMIHQLLGYFKNIRSVTSGDLHDLYCHWDISEKKYYHRAPYFTHPSGCYKILYMIHLVVNRVIYVTQK